MSRRLLEGRGIVDHIDLDGLDISIEVEAGGTRTGTNHKGERWENKVSAAYGYIKGTNSPDGEALDVWVKKNPKEGKQVYVVHQLTPDGSKFDEDKVMLGYSSRDEAIKAFKAHAFKPTEMFGGCSEFQMEHFKVIAYAARKSSVMIASQKMYDDFVERKLLPRGIKSPIQLAQVVKEGADMNALRITYKNPIVVESAFDLALRNDINVLRTNLELVFEKVNDLREFIRVIDETQEDRAHLGDLHSCLPESMSEITEANEAEAHLMSEPDCTVEEPKEDPTNTDSPFTHTPIDGIDEILIRAGVKRAVVESTWTPLVHKTREVVSGINESTNQAIAQYMVNYAVKKQRALMESVTALDIESATRRFTNTLLKYPNTPASKILEAVAVQLMGGDIAALREHIGALTGLSIDEYANALVVREWAGNKISKEMFSRLIESTDANWNINCPDRGEAFKRAVHLV